MATQNVMKFFCLLNFFEKKSFKNCPNLKVRGHMERLSQEFTAEKFKGKT